MRIHADHACVDDPAERLTALSAAVDRLLASWHGPDAVRFEELWLSWRRAAGAVCSSLDRPPARLPRPRTAPELDPASLSPTPTWVLAQMHAWQRDVGDLARDLEGGAGHHPGDWRIGLAEQVTALARLRGVVGAGASIDPR